MSTPVASSGRVLALDPGSRRVGVAVSNSERSMAFPRPAIPAGDELIRDVGQLVDEEQVAIVVVGLPRRLDGGEGASAAMARHLAEELERSLETSGIEVRLHDERLTTVSAQDALRSAGRSAKDQREVIDSAAATVILESWIQCQQ